MPVNKLKALNALILELFVHSHSGNHFTSACVFFYLSTAEQLEPLEYLLQ